MANDAEFEVVKIRRTALKSLVEDAYKEGWFDGDRHPSVSGHIDLSLYESYRNDWGHSDAKGVLDRYLDPRPGIQEHPATDTRRNLPRVAETALVALKQARSGQPCSSILVDELIEQLEKELGIRGI